MHQKAQAAWFNQAIKATKGRGKMTRPKFKTMKEFYDWDREILSIFDPNLKEKVTEEDLNRLFREKLEELEKGG